MRRTVLDSLRTSLSRCTAFLRRKRLDARLEEELQSHIDLATEENIALGMSARQARTAALRAFGGITQTRETYRLRRGLPLLDQLARDLRFGLRQLYRSPGFALTAILTLALGLGANTAVFSLINGLLLRPLPVPHADQLAVIGYTRSDFDEPNYYFSYPMFRALEQHREIFQSLTAMSTASMQVRSSSGNVKVPGSLVSGQYFQLLETPPLLGRYLTPDDDKPGNPNGFSVVISASFWRTWFNRAPDVVGRKIVLANVPFTVVGVMPGNFIGAEPLARPQIFAPLTAEPVIAAPYDSIADGEHNIWLQILARRNPGISVEQANAALRAASNSIIEQSIKEPASLKDSQKNHFQLTADPGSRGYSYLRSQFQKPLLVVFSLCSAMLLLACLNLASLLMARAAARERELATRLAIGATRGRLIQQLLLESLLIASLGTAAGLAAAPLISRALAALILGNNPDAVLDTALDPSIFLFAAGITLLATLLIGLLPALRATSGGAGRGLSDQIKNGSHARSAQDRRKLLPRILMASEVALALLLVVGAGLLAASLTRLYRTGLGFDPKGVVNLDLDMDKQPLKGPALIRWYQSFGDALARQPGVESVSFDSITPLSGSMEAYVLKTPFSKGPTQVEINDVAPNYFHTMRIPILEGRDFDWNPPRSAGLEIVLNQTAATTLFPGRSALGQFIPHGTGKPLQVIAVVADTHYISIRKAPRPGGYLPITGRGGDEDKISCIAVLRVKGPAQPVADAARKLAAQMAPDIPAPILTTMSSQLDDSIASERMMAMLSVFFAACALLVTAIGLYGTLAYATARRTSEIGIRMALGAQRTQVVALVFRENAWVSASGCVAGLIAALLASKALANFLYSTSTRDPWVLVGSVAALALIASAASLLPAIRAARIEPITALRAE